MGLVLSVPIALAILSPQWLSVAFWSLGGAVVFAIMISAFGGSFLTELVDLLSSFQL